MELNLGQTTDSNGAVHFVATFHVLPELQNAPRISRYQAEFKEIAKLGRGAYGQVFLCRHIISDLELGYYAVKKIPVGDQKPWLANILREVKALEGLRHNNIVSYKHAWLERHQLSDNSPEVLCLFIVSINDGFRICCDCYVAGTFLTSPVNGVRQQR